MSSNFLSPNPSKTEFFIFGLPQQLSEPNNPTIHLPNNVVLSPFHSAHNLSVIFDNNLSKFISAVSKSFSHNIREVVFTILLPAPLLILPFTPKRTIILLNLPATQTNHLQLVLNSAAHAVTKTPKFHHIFLFYNLFTGSR